MTTTALSLAEKISHLSLKDNFELGKQYLKDRSYIEAISCLRQVPESHLEYGEALYLLGCIFLPTDEQTAIDYFKRISFDNPKYPDAIIEIAKIYQGQAAWEVSNIYSRCVFRVLFASDENKNQAHLLCGRAMHFLDSQQDAIHHLNEFLKSPSASDEDKNQAHCLYGRALHQKEDKLHGIEYLKKVKHGEDNSGSSCRDYHIAQLFLGKSHLVLRRYDKAISYLQIASGLEYCSNARDESPYFLGLCLYQIGKQR